MLLVLKERHLDAGEKPLDVDWDDGADVVENIDVAEETEYLCRGISR